MTDYTKLIDAETWAFIERTNSFYPPDAAAMTMAENRKVYDTMCRVFDAGYPAGVTADDSSIQAPSHALPIRTYRSAQPDASATVLYFHGGGFMLGGLESHDSICAEFCAGTGYELVSVDYRLAPEHLHPASFEDAVTAFQWAARTYEGRIVLAGDSAGGNLAAAVCHATRGEARKPAGQVLIYPALGGDQSRGSYAEHAEAPMLTIRDVEFYGGIRTGGADSAGEVALWPLAAADFSNLPPTFIAGAECDPLCSDGEAYGTRIVAAGGKAIWLVDKGLVHGSLRARHSVGRARASFARIVEAMRALGKGEWPW